MKLSSPLQLQRETLRVLNDQSLRFAWGGFTQEVQPSTSDACTVDCPTTSTGSYTANPTHPTTTIHPTGTH